MDKQEQKLWRKVVETAQQWDFWKRRHEDEGVAMEWLAPNAPPARWTATPERVDELTKIIDKEQVALKAYLEAVKEWGKYSGEKAKAHS